MKKEILTKSFLLTVLAGISTYPISARALDCTATPDCATLGYTMSAADCTDKPTVKCPTDTSKVFCKKDVFVACAVGSVLGNDKKCYNAGNLPSTVKPIGVVFDVTNKLAVALDQTNLLWSNENVDIPTLENRNGTLNGQQNTATIIAYVKSSGKTGKYPAAEYCASYKPSTVAQSRDWYAEGKWFLPSIEELRTLLHKKRVVNASLQKVNVGTVSDNNYWTSVEVKTDRTYVVNMSTNSGGAYGIEKNSSKPVRPVLYYGDETSMPILYGDGTVSNTILSDKTPVGIVFDTTNKLALALNDTGSSVKWSIGYCDVPSLTNCSSASTISSCGVDGKTNTQNLQSSTCSTFPPAQAVKAYNKGSSCTATFCKQGNWFVPSARDLQTIQNKHVAINATLEEVGGTTLSGNYWASTEYSQVDAWKMEMSTNMLNFDDKVDTVAKVRPVVKYVLPSLDESGGGI